MIPVLILVIYILSIILIKSADHMVLGIRHLSKSTGKTFILSALLLALATSFPELFVGVISAAKGQASLSLGNILGANIANLSLVTGIAVIVVGKVNVRGTFLKRDVSIALIAGILPLLLVFDGEITRLEGIVLLGFYGAYASSFFRRRFLEIAKEIEERTFIHKFFRKITHIDGSKAREWSRLLLAVAGLLISASLIVRVTTQLAQIAHIPIFLIGLILLSLGTTLPELGFSLRSLEDKEPTMFFGNLLGSTIANSTLIVGLAAVISPIKIGLIQEYRVAAIAFIVIFLTFWVFIKSNLKLERWEAGVLLILYLIFVVAEFI